MKKMLIVAAFAAIGLANSVFANSTHTCQGNADCSTNTGPTTNQGGQGGAGGAGGQGGAGGRGGSGGTGITGGSFGGSVEGNTLEGGNVTNAGNSKIGNGFGNFSPKGGSVGDVSASTDNANNASQNVTFTSPADTHNVVEYKGTYKVKTTQDVSLGAPASGPCNGFSGGLGFSVPGVTAAANMSKVDEGCASRETARIARILGRDDIANAVLENIPLVQEALKAKADRDSAKKVEVAPASVNVSMTEDRSHN